MSEGRNRGCGRQQTGPQGIGFPLSTGESPGSCAKLSADPLLPFTEALTSEG